MERPYQANWQSPRGSQVMRLLRVFCLESLNRGRLLP